MRSQKPRGAVDTGSSSASARLLKWVGAATAIISLILGARQLFTIITDRTERSRESAEFAALARQQAGRAEFAEAWHSLDRAEDRSRSEATDAARLDIAFRWLEEGRPGLNQPFSRITDAVVPALDRALLNSQHPRRADILAHLGWATFLKWRETGTGDPAPLATNRPSRSIRATCTQTRCSVTGSFGRRTAERGAPVLRCGRRRRQGPRHCPNVSTRGPAQSE